MVGLKDKLASTCITGVVGDVVIRVDKARLYNGEGTVSSELKLANGSEHDPDVLCRFKYPKIRREITLTVIGVIVAVAKLVINRGKVLREVSLLRLYQQRYC